MPPNDYGQNYSSGKNIVLHLYYFKGALCPTSKTTFDGVFTILALRLAYNFTPVAHSSVHRTSQTHRHSPQTVTLLPNSTIPFIENHFEVFGISAINLELILNPNLL